MTHKPLPPGSKQQPATPWLAEELTEIASRLLTIAEHQRLISPKPPPTRIKGAANADH